MIGDLVGYNFELEKEGKGIGRVTTLQMTSLSHRICVECVEFSTDVRFGKNNYDYYFKDVYPLPLTMETLEESGFIRHEIEPAEEAPDLITYDYILQGSCGDTPDETRRKKVVVHIDGMYNFYVTKEDGRVICRIKYVHELQHYLRLIGVKNEIFYSNSIMKMKEQ
jgi:hypothetical protein